MTRRYISAWVCLLCAWQLTAAAQDGSMGQGQAAIAVRSDVKLAVKGTGGTTSERLAKLGQAVGDQMGEIRSCYRKQVASSPEVIGALRVRIELTDQGKTKVEILDETAPVKTLGACVTKALTLGRYKDVGRPAAALLALDFDNSRARGEAAMNEHKAEKAQVTAQASGDGSRQASWSTEGNEVRFTVKVDAANSAGLDLVLHGLQSGYAAFLDCRRKCEKGGLSPEGDIEGELQLDTKARAKLTLGKISVKHERAPVCSDKAFKRVQFDKPASAVRASFVVHFAP